LPEFVNASYAQRYELFCHKLVRERHYNAAALLLSACDSGLDGGFSEPADDLTFAICARALVAHAAAYSSADVAYFCPRGLRPSAVRLGQRVPSAWPSAGAPTVPAPHTDGGAAAPREGGDSACWGRALHPSPRAVPAGRPRHRPGGTGVVRQGGAGAGAG
jgi:hypothetical protein